MKTAFSYHRYSKDQQRDGYSLEVQRNITKKLAEKHHCIISAVYEDEGISGATIDKRPQMLALLEDLKSVKPNYIICVDQDRISRGNEFWYIKSLMSRCNTSLITEKEGVINFKEDISQDFLSDIIAAAAKYERGMIQQRIKRAVAERASKGYHVGNLTNIHGYDYKDHSIVINEAEANLVRRIFNMSAGGQGYTGIARQLNDERIPSKYNGYWTAERIRYILTNRFYCGYIRHGDQIIKGNHEPIIDELLFKKAQDTIARRHKVYKTKPTKYLLTGFLKCDNCNSNLGGNFKKNNGYYKATTIYKCNGYVSGICHRPVFLNLDKTEEYVLDKVKKKIIELQLKIKSGVIKIKKEPDLSSLDAEKKIIKLQKDLSKIATEYTEGFLLQKEYRKQFTDINAKITALKKINNNHNPDLVILKDIDPLTIFEEADFDDKKRIIGMIVDKIVVSRFFKGQTVGKRLKFFWNEFN